MQQLLSSAAVVVETRAVGIDETLLWPEEDAFLGSVVSGRRWDWVHGRRCARLAIQELGIEPAPILSGAKREPLWPTGVVGAITHTHGFAAAAVARSSDMLSLGVDAEPDEPLPKGVLHRISHSQERSWIERGVSGVASADRLLFCIKEAVYKTWFPVAQDWLGFEDAVVELDQGSQSFSVQIVVDGPIKEMAGRYRSADGIVMTAIEVSR